MTKTVKNNTSNYSTGYYSTGNFSTGDRSTGNRSTGDFSTGNCSTGDGSTGNFSTGNWSTNDHSTGHFCTEETKTIRVFNKDCSLADWRNADKPEFLYFDLTEWVPAADMTDQEKTDNETFRATGGFLRVYDYKEAFQKSYHAASQEDKDKLLKLPNFDAAIFKEISGIDVSKQTSCYGKTVVIDGVEYEFRRIT